MDFVFDKNRHTLTYARWVYLQFKWRLKAYCLKCHTQNQTALRLLQNYWMPIELIWIFRWVLSRVFCTRIRFTHFTHLCIMISMLYDANLKLCWDWLGLEKYAFLVGSSKYIMYIIYINLLDVNLTQNIHTVAAEPLKLNIEHFPQKCHEFLWKILFLCNKCSFSLCLLLIHE